MANEDILLSIGADPTALRKTLREIERELKRAGLQKLDFTIGNDTIRKIREIAAGLGDARRASSDLNREFGGVSSALNQVQTAVKGVTSSEKALVAGSVDYGREQIKRINQAKELSRELANIRKATQGVVWVTPQQQQFIANLRDMQRRLTNITQVPVGDVQWAALRSQIDTVKRSISETAKAQKELTRLNESLEASVQRLGKAQSAAAKQNLADDKKLLDSRTALTGAVNKQIAALEKLRAVQTDPAALAQIDAMILRFRSLESAMSGTSLSGSGAIASQFKQAKVEADALRVSQERLIKTNRDYEAAVQRLGRQQSAAAEQNLTADRKLIDSRTALVSQVNRQVNALEKAKAATKDPAQIAALDNLISQYQTLGTAAVSATQKQVDSLKTQSRQLQLIADYERAAVATAEQRQKAADAYAEKVQKAGQRQAKAGQENLELDKKLFDSRTRLTGAINKQEAALQKLRKSTIDPAQIAAIDALLVKLQTLLALLGGANLQQLKTLDSAFKALKVSADDLGRAMDKPKNAFETFFDRMKRYSQIAAGMIITYNALRAVMAGVQFIVDVDREMSRLAGTLQTNEERARVLPAAYELIHEGMSRFGLSTADASKLVLELQKALGGNVQMIKAAFLPAVSLIIQGETDQGEAVRALLGLYNVYGKTLEDTLTPAEKMTQITDKLHTASNVSRASVAGLTEALQFAASQSANAGVKYEELLALLTLLQDSLFQAGRSGTGLSRAMESLTKDVRNAAQVFEVPIEPDLTPLQLLLKVLEKVRNEMAVGGQAAANLGEKIDKAFPTIQARRVIETLARDIGGLGARVDRINGGLGQTEIVLKEFEQSVSASAKAIAVELIVAIDKFLNLISGEKTPGRFTAFAKFLRNIAQEFKDIGDMAERAAKAINDFYNMFNREVPQGPQLRTPSGLPKTGAPQMPFGSPPNPLSPEYADYIAKQIKATQEAKKLAGSLGDLPTVDIGAVIPQSFRQQALEDAAVKQRMEDLAKVQSELRREFERSSREFDLYTQLEQATIDADIALKNYQKTVNDFLPTTKGGKGYGDIKDVEKAGREYFEDLKKREQARGRVADSEIAKQKLQEEGLEALTAALAKNADELREYGLTAEQAFDAKLLREYEAELAFIREQMEKLRVSQTAGGGLVPDLDPAYTAQYVKLSEELERQAQERRRIIRLQYQQQQLDEVIKATESEEEARINTIAAFAAKVDEQFAKIAEGANYSTEAIIALNEANSKFIDKSLGYDKVEQDLRVLSATLGKVGADATIAAEVAKLGFGSMDDLVLILNQRVKGLGDAVAEAIKKMAKNTEDLKLAKLTEDTQALERQLKAEADALGLVGEEAIKVRAAFDIFKKPFAELTEEQRKQIENWAKYTQQMKTVEEVAGLVALGFDKITAALIAQNNELGEERLRRLQQGVEVLERANTLSERMFRTQLDGLAQVARATGDTFGFFLATFQKTVSESANIWGQLADLARETARNISQAFSDFFFDLFTNRLQGAAEIFKSFLNSMLRSMANFLGNQVTQLFFGAMGGGGGGGGISLPAGTTITQPNGQTITVGAGGATTGGGGGGTNFVTINPGQIQSIITGLQNAPANWASGSGIWGGVSNVLFGTQTFGSVSAGIAPASAGVEFAGLAPDAIGTVSELSGVMGGLGQAASGLNVALAGVAAAMSVADNIMTFMAGNWEEGVLRIGTAVAGGIVGGLLTFGNPVGILGGIAIGDFIGKMLGGLFGGPSNYDLKRIEAAQQAQEALGFVGANYQAAATSNDLITLHSALNTAAGGSGGSVRTELVLPSSLAQQLGINGQQIGDQIVTQWADLTAEQFEAVIQAFKENPDLIKNSVRGSGDVPYLSQEDAQKVADAIRDAAIGTIEAFVALSKATDQINEFSADLSESIFEILPPDLAEQFQQNVLDPITQRMIDIIHSGLPAEEIQRQIAALGTELDKYTALVGLYQQLTLDMAATSGDLATQTAAAVRGLEKTLEAANKAVEDAQERLDEAVTVDEQLAAATELRNAVLARYQLEKELIANIEQTIAQLYQDVGGPLVATATAIAALKLQYQDSRDGIDELLSSLLILGTTAESVSGQIFAIQSGLQALIALIPSLAESMALPTFDEDLGAITDFNTDSLLRLIAEIGDTAGPFLSELDSLIADAMASGDLQGALLLLQQQAEAIKGLGQAALDAVERWRDAAIAAAEAAAQAEIDALEEAYQEEEDLAQEAFDAAVQAINDRREADIAAVEEASEARAEQLNEELDSIEEMIAAVEEWQSIIESVNDLINDLLLGTQAPPSPANQYAIAQDAFNRAYAAFLADPTAEGATDAQEAAQDLLTAAQGVFPRTSNEYDALFDSIIDALSMIAAVAGEEMGPATAEDLEAQTERIAAELEQLQIDTEAAIEAINAAADEEILALEDEFERWKKKHKEDLDAAVEGVKQRLKDTVDAINDAADDIAGDIVGGMEDLLDDNTILQNQLLDSLVKQQEDMLRALTGGMPIDEYLAQEAGRTNDLLNDIYMSIDAFLRGVSGVGTESTRGLNTEAANLPTGVWDSTGTKMLYPSTTSVTNTLNIAEGAIVVQGATSDPAKIASDVMAAVESSVRTGRLGSVIMQRVG